MVSSVFHIAEVFALCWVLRLVDVSEFCNVDGLFSSVNVARHSSGAIMVSGPESMLADRLARRGPRCDNIARGAGRSFILHGVVGTHIQKTVPITSRARFLNHADVCDARALSCASRARTTPRDTCRAECCCGHLDRGPRPRSAKHGCGDASKTQRIADSSVCMYVCMYQCIPNTGLFDWGYVPWRRRGT